MDTLFRLFLKLESLPGQLSLNTAFHILMLITGVGFLYLLTLQEDEEGKVEDYLLRLQNRMSSLREKALSRHRAIINVTARVISSIGDKLFGPSLFSPQAIGVSVSLGLFCLNFYYFASEFNTQGGNWNRLGSSLIFLCFASFPAVLDFIRPNKRSRYSRMRRPYNEALSLWWALLLVIYVVGEHVRPFTCVSCVPRQYRGFFFAGMLMLTAVAIVGTTLFTPFIIVTRFSLKKLATSESTTKSIIFLLVGCLPIAIFWILLKVILLIVTHTESASNSSSDPNSAFNITAQEWVAIGSLVVLALSFFINVAFLLAPVLFFSMAALLFVHRLLWPILERPLGKLNRVGISKHPRVIMVAGLVLILLGIGKLEWLKQALDFFGIG